MYKEKPLLQKNIYNYFYKKKIDDWNYCHGWHYSTTLNRYHLNLSISWRESSTHPHGVLAQEARGVHEAAHGARGGRVARRQLAHVRVDVLRGRHAEHVRQELGGRLRPHPDQHVDTVFWKMFGMLLCIYWGPQLWFCHSIQFRSAWGAECHSTRLTLQREVKKVYI